MPMAIQSFRHVRRSPFVAIVALLLTALAAPGAAQDMGQPGQPQQPVQQEPETTVYQDWEVACIDTPNGERCQMQQTLQIQDEQAQGLFLQATIRRDGDQHVIEVLVPLGVDLRPGIRMQVDDAGEEMDAGYVTCVQQGCVAGRELNSQQMSSLRGGQALTVAFRALHQEQPFVFDVSLMGFTDASNELR
ncbi:invasion associated locus B family protein [Thioalkalivibrio versutus]|uniref:invasion associated locus B family protein n=1 Tax=Thioalkalivibrio versutus TaxID=106634 RepID=UPI000475E53A|nr:invasion associated locus B family protein [Thioalkalivibrio versutus]OOC48719.1 invasion-associated locus B family protein [Thioalkalivibrio versutus]